MKMMMVYLKVVFDGMVLELSGDVEFVLELEWKKVLMVML